MIKNPFFLVLILLSLVSWGGWYIVLHNISPLQSPSLAYPLMYGMLFFSFCFSGALFTGLLWKAFFPTKSSYVCLRRGLREGVIFAIGGCVAVFFLQYQSLSWNTGGVIAVFGILMEAFFLLRQRDA